MQKEKSKAPLSGILPLSGTQEVTGGPLRGKLAAEGKKSEARSPLSGIYRWAVFTAERHFLGLGFCNLL